MSVAVGLGSSLLKPATPAFASEEALDSDFEAAQKDSSGDRPSEEAWGRIQGVDSGCWHQLRYARDSLVQYV